MADSTPAVRLTLLPEKLSIFRFQPSAPVPDLAAFTGVWSVTRTRREISVVAEEGACSAADEEDPGWRCLYVDGPIPFNLTGIVAGITSAIAAAGLPVFVLSTFDSDLILLRGESVDRALRALRDKGYAIGVPPLPELSATRQPHPGRPS
ncbi:ACT domain-containing protein [Arthrobacter citreus]|uniref:ACT domain-containing protein n=1 Tax=Arthrobacter citreus TaxID=1670 RepID=A0ABZ2ZUY6_9MICC